MQKCKFRAAPGLFTQGLILTDEGRPGCAALAGPGYDHSMVDHLSNFRPDAQPDTVRAVLGDALLSMGLDAGQAWGVKDVGSGQYVWVSAGLAQWLGGQPQDWLGRSEQDELDAPTAALLRTADQTARAQGRPLDSEHRFTWRGERREVKVTRHWVERDGRAWLCLRWEDLAPARQRDTQLRVALDQLEQQQKANDQLRRELAEHSLRDQASGLNSRAHFDDQMRRELDLSTREHREFALVYMCLDSPTAAVQALGAPAHERICEAMGRLIKGNTRAMDASCRLDDQHFAVLLSGVGLATAHARMEGLRRQCATQIVMLDGHELGFSVAMGVASFPHTAQQQDELIQAGRGALAEAQRRGGNTVVLASIRLDAARPA